MPVDGSTGLTTLDVGLVARQAAALIERNGWPRERLLDHQQRELRRVLQHAVTASQFYRETLADLVARKAPLAEFPVLTKRLLMDNFDHIVTDRRLSRRSIERHLAGERPGDLLLGEYRVAATGGTTGERGIFVYDDSAWLSVIANTGRFQHALGVLPTTRSVGIGASSPMHLSMRFYAELRATRPNSPRLDLAMPVAQVVEALNAYQPEALVTYPSFIRVLAGEQLAGRLRIAPRVVRSGAETLTQPVRDLAQAAWQVPVIDSYACTEVGSMGQECQHVSGIHLAEDLCVFENVDERNRPVPEGQYGAKLLVTTLTNRTCPLVRYELTDIVTLTTAPCRCGLPFARIGAIEGRKEEVLRLPRRGGSLMRASSRFVVAGLEGRPGMEDGPEDVHSSSSEGDDGGVVAFALAALAVVEGAAVVVAERAEGGLVEDALEALVAAGGPAQEARLAGLAQDRGDAGSGGERVGGAEAGEVACLGDQLGGEHGPHAGQAADEGRIRVAVEQRRQLAVELDEPRAGGERLGGKLADQVDRHALGRDGDGLLGGGGKDAVGQGVEVGQAACGPQVAHEARLAGGAQLGRSDELGQQMQRALAGQVEAALEAGEDADQQVVQARQALGLRLDQVAAAADQQPDLEVELGGGLDRAQVGAGADLVGDGAGVARVGLVLAADRALAGAIDGQARDMNKRESGLGQHGFGEPGDAADDVEADADRATESAELAHQLGDGGRRVRQLAVELHDAEGVDRRDPVDVLGDVDSDADPHGASRWLQSRHPARAVVALPSDDPQSPISGRGGVAVSGDLPPEPSRAASMKTIPTPPPCRDPGMPGSRRQALPKQHLNGRAA